MAGSIRDRTPVYTQTERVLYLSLLRISWYQAISATYRSTNPEEVHVTVLALMDSLQ